MSYILDALKKSEQERDKGKVPRIDTIQNTSMRKKRGAKPPWLLISVLALALNALLFGIWIYTDQSDTPSEPNIAAVSPAMPEQSANITETNDEPKTENTQLASIAADTPLQETGTAQTAIETPVEPEAEDTQLENEPANIEGQETTSEQAAIALPVQPEEDQASPLAENDALPEAETEPEIASPDNRNTLSGEEDSTSDETEELKDDTPIPFEKLPSAVKSTIPEIRISLHYYAVDRSSRKVSINGRMVREGYAVDQDLVVNEITKDGVIFSFRETLFSYEVFSR